MPLLLIGLGLGDEKDVTVAGLEAIQSADTVYLEAYTSVLGVKKEKLEAFYNKEIHISDRYEVEESTEKMLDQADAGIVAFLAKKVTLAANGVAVDVNQMGYKGGNSIGRQAADATRKSIQGGTKVSETTSFD